MNKIIMVGLMVTVFMVTNSFAEEISYTSNIKSIFDQKCIDCHGADAPEYKEFKKDKKKYIALNKGPRMDSYTYLLYFVGWPDTGALMRRLDDGNNTKNRTPGNMYINLGDTEAERQRNLETFKKWVGNWSLKRWSVAKKEEIEQMKVTY
jgi:hypothetical protein